MKSTIQSAFYIALTMLILYYIGRIRNVDSDKSYQSTWETGNDSIPKDTSKPIPLHKPDTPLYKGNWIDVEFN